MAKKFLFKIVSADGKTYEDNIEELNVETSNGTIGILADHLPLIANILISVFSTKTDGKMKYFTISGGLLSVESKQVLILDDTFESSDELDKERVLKAKERAEKILSDISLTNSDYDRQVADISLKKALNRLKILN